MHAADVMTTHVITVSPETGTREIAALLLKYRISAVPVIDANRQVLGMVSEGDLMCREENETRPRSSWWVSLFYSATDNAARYIKTHGRRAHEIMSRGVIAVSEETPLYEIATLLEKHHIKRVPVTRDGLLTGLVSRANLLHGLTAKGAKTSEPGSVDDRSIRKSLLYEFSTEVGLNTARINVVVEDGVVQLWGLIETDLEKQAAQLAAENIPGVLAVENNLARVPLWIYAG
ncbi:MAG: CBS domain-containing protein [Motiliproteus sp.]|jgi:CBS domain-containing protein